LLIYCMPNTESINGSALLHFQEQLRATVMPSTSQSMKEELALNRRGAMGHQRDCGAACRYASII
ncbi:hypothetical protein, partial [Paraburkholderia dipogonis]|uniref:hypothetical protein n=1 Tax=Paraburkholderia dipogonis TaxID=1211383 RepID=UPI0038B79D90